MVKDLKTDLSKSSLIEKIGGSYIILETQAVGHLWSSKDNWNVIK